jgi:alpha-mannosidase
VEHLDSGRSKTLDMIGNAHLDPVWLWRWQEGFQEAKATFQSVLDLMREYDDFLFTSSSAALYEWIEHNEPAMFAEIKQRVAEGRWEICGGWWIQPDCNIPSGESFVRQGLYGQRYFAEHLGVTSTVGYNVDSFGHAATLPQILLKSGMPSYVFMRPHPHEKRLPSRLFWWESQDGSRVLTFRVLYEYISWGKDLRQHVARCAGELRGNLDELMCFYGVGNHGGGPTRENIESIRDLNGEDGLPTLIFSTPGRYFARMRESGMTPPVVLEELQMHAVGCYAAHSGVKRWNRKAEQALVTAEKLSSVAADITGLPYPPDFRHAWKGVLFNQFHDILAGTSIESAYEDARALYGEAMAIAGRNLNGAVQSLSWNIGIPREEGTRPLVVFNPHAWDVSAPVELEFGRLRETDVLIDADGKPVPIQSIRPDAAVASGSRSRIVFPADVPALGWSTYRVVSSEAAQTFPSIEATDTSLENEYLRLELDPETGCLSSLYDKRLDFELLRAPAACGQVLADPSDTWSHGVVRYDDTVGQFMARSTRLLEHGPVKSVIRVVSGFERSELVQDFTMYPDRTQVDVRVSVDWHEHFRVLKLSFPINVFFSTATFEIPYGSLERPANGDEVPGHSWVDLSGVGRNKGDILGVSILNDGKYSFDVTEKVIRMTVLRSPIYAHHDPYVPQPDEPYRFIDQGPQEFTYSILPHAGSWQDAETVRRAAELNAPLIAQVESFHDGPLSQRAGFICVDNPQVNVTILKRAEEGDDLILRCYETSGSRADVRIELPTLERAIEAQLRPGEIKTFRIPVDRSEAIRETDLIEWT